MTPNLMKALCAAQKAVQPARKSVRSLSAAEAIARLVDRSAGDSGCWPWTGSRTDVNYGRFTIGGKAHYAHRVAFELAHGPIPDGLFVMHSCDNPPCCNPAHLSAGTPRENTLDAVAKGRIARGEATGHAKLSVEQVRTIRARHSTDGTASLAAEFRVHRTTIQRIVRGSKWRWVS